MADVVPRWEWRTFAHTVSQADTTLDAMTPASVEESDDLYLLTHDGDNVKIRDQLMDIKVLRETDSAGLQRWEPILKVPFPLDVEAAQVVFASLRRPCPEIPSDGLSLDAFMAAARVGATDGPRAVVMHKRRARYTVGGCLAERSTLEAGGHQKTSIAIESTDPAAVAAAVAELGLRDYVNVDVPTGVRMLIDQVPERYAVIDVGTNSIKLHVAELDANGRGPWRTVVDRAVVTRLGEDLEATGEIGAKPLERTARVISEMADEARHFDVQAIAAVGTAGSRTARNRADVVATVQARSGLALEVISGEDEGRLAYMAVAAGVGIGDGAVVAFDTGGGSSQFTFGHGSSVDEQFSLPVGAVGFTERFGLAEAVPSHVVAEAMAAIAAELSLLDGRPQPDGIVAMGGAVTNLAAVKHGLTTYDPDVIQGTVLDRAEIDRQIDRYRSIDSAGRRSIIGLQTARAEVILAGACIVRTIMDKLGRDSVTVSDHGLRHGLLIDRFGSGGSDIPAQGALGAESVRD
jgi:exopolyphosphatase / guanosine-5'-triphosphate,3'-diphosphate pyrophosphatase